MTTRGRSFTQTQTSEWDTNDYYESTYDSQYPEEHMSGSVSGGNLDHCRLYITNIPRGLNDEGLRAAFSKFGTLLEVYMSKDPRKKYGLVRFETAGEAKLAMMKMNKTEPLKLMISIANKPKKDKDDRPRKEWQEKSSNESRDRSSNKFDSGSVSSKGRSRKNPTLLWCGFKRHVHDPTCVSPLYGASSGILKRTAGFIFKTCSQQAWYCCAGSFKASYNNCVYNHGPI